MSEATWDGVLDAQSYSTEWQKTCHAYINAAKAGDWPTIFRLLDDANKARLVNSARPGGKAWYTALHHAAYNGAPVEIVERLVGLGAWRSLRDARGERAVDVARRRGHDHLVEALEPVVRTQVDADKLALIQQHFHRVIRTVIAEYNITTPLRLPELEVLLELEQPHLWFAVPGMYGGFSFRLNRDLGAWVLRSDSWSRVLGGSYRYIVSPAGSLLIDSGFV